MIQQEREAHRLGVTSVPAILVGDDLETAELVIGAVRYPWLKTAVDRALGRLARVAAACAEVRDPVEGRA